MNETDTTANIIIRTGRGLTIAGTRITLYSVMDYLEADWPPKLIKDHFNLTDEQIEAALAYIAANRPEVEAEYRLVLQKAEENRRYWTEYNREHLEKVAAMPHKPEQAEIWKRLKRRQAQLEPV
jgi:uncharacterized protein (DUF433 family)